MAHSFVTVPMRTWATRGGLLGFSNPAPNSKEADVRLIEIIIVVWLILIGLAGSMFLIYTVIRGIVPVGIVLSTEPHFELTTTEGAITCNGGPENGCELYHKLVSSSHPLCYDCEGGPCIPYAAWCLQGDLDWDGDVDLADFALWQRAMTGPREPEVGELRLGVAEPVIPGEHYRGRTLRMERG